MIKLFVSFLILFYSTLSVAQTKFNASFDYAVFRSDGMATLEIYYSFYNPGMVIKTENSQSFITGQLAVSIQNLKTSELVVNKKWKFNTLLTKKNVQQNLIGLLKFPLNEGKYKCFVKGNDFLNKSHADSIEFKIEIGSLSSKQFVLSDVEVASALYQFSTNTNSIFYKNSLEIIPNPSLLFGEQIPVLYCYYELYNLNNPKYQSRKLSITQTLKRENNRAVFSKNKFIDRRNYSIFDIGIIRVDKFPTGVYTLSVEVKDTSEHYSESALKKIFIYNPSVIDSTPITQSTLSGLLADEISTFSKEELIQYFNDSKLLATRDEVNAWNKLNNVEGMRKFLINFWSKRDSDPSTPVNETKREYFKRVRFADNHYKTINNKKGSRSDRGRIYILYGSPSEIERHPNESEQKPYEIWFYNEIEGGIYFVFADFSGYGDYQLIHSTKRGELQDPNWQSTISAR